MTLQEKSLQLREDGAAWPAEDPVLSNVPPHPNPPTLYLSEPESRSIPSRQVQLEAFCLHLLQFMNPPSGAQSRLSERTVGVEKEKDDILPTWNTHPLHHVCRPVCQSVSLRNHLLQKSPAVQLFVFGSLQNFILLWFFVAAPIRINVGICTPTNTKAKVKRPKPTTC